MIDQCTWVIIRGLKREGMPDFVQGMPISIFDMSPDPDEHNWYIEIRIGINGYFFYKQGEDNGNVEFIIRDQ